MAGRLPGLGQWERGGLGVIANRKDLIDRDRYGIRPDQDHDFVRRFRLDLAADHAADRLLDGRAGDESHLVAAEDRGRTESGHADENEERRLDVDTFA